MNREKMLTPYEQAVVDALKKHRQGMTHEQILEVEPKVGRLSNISRAHVKNIRKKTSNNFYIQTVKGTGYKLLIREGVGKATILNQKGFTPHERNIMREFIKNPQGLTHKEIVGIPVPKASRQSNVSTKVIERIRRKTGQKEFAIRSIWGFGYILTPKKKSGK
jgi:DNA-binding response OmpR family regulator